MDEARYFNDQADELLAKEIWWPVPEFTNLIGNREIVNNEVYIKRNGDVSVYEHFVGTFTSDMDFRKYPFDTQEFKIVIESFTYDENKLKFMSKLAAYQREQVDNPEWTFADAKGAVVPHKYEAWPETYSSYMFSIEADRKHGYFIWQFFFPLAMIVVAFNFYASPLLPRLPYNTFIETMIISGYVTIFLTVLIIVLHHQLLQRGREATAARVNMASRLLFPVGNIFAVY